MEWTKNDRKFLEANGISPEIPEIHLAENGNSSGINYDLVEQFIRLLALYHISKGRLDYESDIKTLNNNLNPDELRYAADNLHPAIPPGVADNLRRQADNLDKINQNNNALGG